MRIRLHSLFGRGKRYVFSYNSCVPAIDRDVVSTNFHLSFFSKPRISKLNNTARPKSNWKWNRLYKYYNIIIVLRTLSTQGACIKYKTAAYSMYWVESICVIDENWILHTWVKHGTCMKQGDHNILFQMPEILLFDMFEPRSGNVVSTGAVYPLV